MSTYTYKTKTLPKSAVEALITLSWDHVSHEKDKVITRAVATITVPGFRVGKAPRALAETHLNMDKVYEETVRGLIPSIYKEILEKEKLSPITTPAVNLTEAKSGEDWKLTLTIPLAPQVRLKNYKKKVAEAHKKAVQNEQSKAKSEAGSSTTDPDDGIQSADGAVKKTEQNDSNEKAQNDKDTIETTKEDKKVTAPLSEIFDILLAESELEVPELLTNEEVDRRLVSLLEDIKKVGLTAQQYLDSKKLSEKELRDKYFKDSEDMYKIEFVIAKIADEEKLQVAPAELESILGMAKTNEEKAIAQRNMAWYETLLRKQKVIDFLNAL